MDFTPAEEIYTNTPNGAAMERMQWQEDFEENEILYAELFITRLKTRKGHTICLAT